MSTSTCSKIIITQVDNIEYTITTPTGQNEIIFGKQYDTIVINERPIKKIFYETNKGKVYSLNLKGINTGNVYYSNNLVFYQILSSKHSKLIQIILFFINSQRLLMYYIIFWILVIFQFFFFKFKFKFKKIRFYIYRRWLCKAGLLKKGSIQPLRFNRLQWVLLVTLSVSLLFSLFLNLGKYQFAQYAEKRRVLVSQEMQLSGNYIVPTMFGEPYYNKPPLFFWLTSPFTNTKNVEKVTRSLSVFSLVLFGLIVFLLLRKKRGKYHALAVSFFTLTSWHVLSYLSFTVNLDVLFSIFIFTLFYVNYKIPITKNPLYYFILSYLLCTLAFFTKGLPALWFQMISLIISVLIQKKFKLIFSIKHLIGIILFLISVGAYILIYSKEAQSINYIKQLINESVNVYEYATLTKLKHFILFPAKNMYHYAPLALLIPILLMRRYFIGLIKNIEMSYFLLVLVAGISVFWTSPFYKAYYTLMFTPILFDLLLNMTNIFSKDKFKFTLNYLFISIALIILSNLIYNNLYYLLLIIPFLLLMLLRKYYIYLLLLFSAVLIIWKTFSDMGYYGENENYITPTKSDCKRIALNYKEYDFKILSKQTFINHNVAFYLNYFTGKITSYNYDSFNTNTLYCANSDELSENFVVIDSISQMQWSEVYDNSVLNYIYLLKYKPN